MFPAVSGAVSDADFARQVFPALADADLFLFSVGYLLVFQAFQGIDERSAAGAAGIPGIDILFQFADPVGRTHVRKGLGGLIQKDKFCMGDIGASHAEPFGDPDVRDVVYGIADTFADVGVA